MGGGFFFGCFAILGAIIAACMFLLCFGIGLLSLCEKAENSPNYLKKIVLRMAMVVAALHVCFLFFERISIWRLLFSGFTLFVHYRLALDLPALEATAAMANGALLLMNHFIWFSYFVYSGHGLFEVVTFYLFMIWLVPISIVVSYSSSEILPGFYDSRPAKASANPFSSFGGSSSQKRYL